MTDRTEYIKYLLDELAKIKDADLGTLWARMLREELADLRGEEDPTKQWTKTQSAVVPIG